MIKLVNYDGLYNKEFYGDKLKPINRLSDKKLHFRIIDNGTILPSKFVDGVSFGFGGIVDDKCNFVKGSVVSRHHEGPYTPNEEIEYKSQTAVYLGMLVGVWGHSITDNLKHSWFFFSEVYKKYFKNCPIAYIPWQGGGVTHNLFNVFKILGIDLNKLYPIVKPTKFKTIILPDESFSCSETSDEAFFTAEYVQTIDRIKDFAKKNFSSLNQKKFYFLHGNNNFGEMRIADYFHSKGYQIIKPETLSFEQQINILGSCEDFASTVGSISHNVIFLNDNANVVLIPRKAQLNNYQQMLNQINNHNVFYIDSSLSIFKVRSQGPFCYILSENLRKYFGDEVKEKYTDEDFATFLVYLKYSKSKGLNEDPTEIKYIEKIFPEFLAQLKTHTDLMNKFGIVIK